MSIVMHHSVAVICVMQVAASQFTNANANITQLLPAMYNLNNVFYNYSGQVRSRRPLARFIRHIPY